MSETSEEQVVSPPKQQMAVGPRMMGATVPLEKSKDFRNSSLRLLSWMRPERVRLILVVITSVVSVVMSVVGPKILGNATNLIINGVRSPNGIDFAELHRTILTVGALYLGSAALAYTQGFLLAGVIHRTMRRLRSAVEDKINTLPLGYVDKTPRGDLLSRVTNDIDILGFEANPVLLHRPRVSHRTQLVAIDVVIGKSAEFEKVPYPIVRQLQLRPLLDIPREQPENAVLASVQGLEQLDNPR